MISNPVATRMRRTSVLASVVLGIVSIASTAVPVAGQDDPPPIGEGRGRLQVDIVSAGESDEAQHQVVFTRADGDSRRAGRTAGDQPYNLDAPPGEYQIELDPADGWIVASIECSDGATAEPSLVGGSVKYVSVLLTEGEQIDCDIRIDSGRITAMVKTRPRGDETFELELHEDLFDPETGDLYADYVVDHLRVSRDDPRSFQQPRQGSVWYLPSTVVDRWEFEKVGCDHSAASTGDGSSTVFFNLTAHPDAQVTCTWHFRDRFVPEEGDWRIRETKAEMECPQTDRIPDPKKGSDRRGEITVHAGGRRLEATGAGPGTLRMKKESALTNVYDGKRGEARVRWWVESPEEVVGRDRLPGEARCTLVRWYRMKWMGQ